MPESPTHPLPPPRFWCSSTLSKSCFLPRGAPPTGPEHRLVLPKLTYPFLRSSVLYESTLVVEGVLSEKPCVLRLRGQGSYDERYVKFHQF